MSQAALGILGPCSYINALTVHLLDSEHQLCLAALQ